MARTKKKGMAKKRDEDKAMKRMKTLQRLQRPWSDLPQDMLTLIARKCSFTDQLRLRGVCKNWHSLDGVASTHQLPWLGLVRKTTCTLYDPYYRKAHKGMVDEEIVSCFGLRRSMIYGTKFGWMLLMFPQDSQMILRMCNPFTGEKIALPILSLNMEYTVGVFSISSAPSSSDCICMFLAYSYMDSFTVGTCGVNDKEWNLCEFKSKFYPERDVAYLKGAFYFVVSQGRVATFNVAERQWSVLIDIPKLDHIPHKFAGTIHIVESEGEILLIRRYDKFVFGIVAFVFRLDLGKKAWVEVKSLGSRALFLGNGTSLSLTLTAKDKDTDVADKIFTKNYLGILTTFSLKTLRSHAACTEFYGSLARKNCDSRFWIQPSY